MPISQQKILPLNLNTYDVLLEDTSENSVYFNITRLPPQFTGGRNSFLIGGSVFLEDKSEVKIEILDVDGNTIYQTMVLNYIEGSSRMITVEIYDTTPPGFATITIMGKARVQSNGAAIPEDWRGVYNVRWTKQILVDYNLKNTSPIKFLNQPAATLTENRFVNINSSSFDTNNSQFTASLLPLVVSPVQQGYSIHAQSPTVFIREYLGGKITGSMKVGDTQAVNVDLPITKIRNNRLMFSYKSLITSSVNNGIIKRLTPFYSGSFTASFDGNIYPVTASAVLQYNVITTSSTNIPISYANIRIFDMNTVSGEIYKLRVYNKVATNISDYKLIADVLVGSNEILVSSSVRGNVPIGDIFTTVNYRDNWYAGSLVSNTGRQFPVYKVSGSATYYDSSINTNRFILSSSDDVLMSSIYSYVPIDLTTSKFANAVSESGYFIGTTQPFTLSNRSEYTLTLDAAYAKTSESVSLVGNTPKVDIYLIGIDGTKVVTENPLGQRIGTLEVLGDAQWFEQKQFNFTPAIRSLGTVGLRFVVTNGFWNFSNISLTPASDPQFSPDEIQILIPNTDYYNELLQYKIEFFDINNNSAAVTAITTPTFFTGSAIDLGTLS
jgi:hypothetical protein